jgi:hypothetical protein
MLDRSVFQEKARAQPPSRPAASAYAGWSSTLRATNFTRPRPNNVGEAWRRLRREHSEVGDDDRRSQRHCGGDHTGRVVNLADNLNERLIRPHE